ncbi:MAG: CvpA family protein [Lachnospiraceae bacterium]|nr:CvpA family protein [Lachnospiraceae bacterium]
MEINILFIIVVLMLGIGAVWGWKRGLLESIIRIISCILGILVIVVMAKGIGSFVQKSYVQVIMALVLLVMIQVIHRIVKFLTDTFKLVRAIPVGKLADKLAGAVLGLAEAIFVIWLVFLLIGVFDVADLNAWVIQQVEKSRFLTMIYYSNYLIELLRKVLF